MWQIQQLQEGVYGDKEQPQEQKFHIILSVCITAFIYTVLTGSVESFQWGQKYNCFLIVLSLDFRGIPKGEIPGLQHPEIEFKIMHRFCRHQISATEIG